MRLPALFFVEEDMLLSKGIPLLKNAQNISHTIRSAGNYKKAQILLLIVCSSVNK